MARLSPRSLFHEQSLPHSCVAACMAMVQRWRGEVPTEAEFARHGDGNFESLGGMDGVTIENPKDDSLGITIRRHLFDDCIVALCVSGPPYVRATASAQAASAHGTLCAPGTHGGPRHAIVIYRAEGDSFDVLDPWYTAASQPLGLSEDDLLKCYMGPLAVARR